MRHKQTTSAPARRSCTRKNRAHRGMAHGTTEESGWLRRRSLVPETSQRGTTENPSHAAGTVNSQGTHATSASWPALPSHQASRRNARNSRREAGPLAQLNANAPATGVHQHDWPQCTTYLSSDIQGVAGLLSAYVPKAQRTRSRDLPQLAR